jgi:hypothetical protein
MRTASTSVTFASAGILALSLVAVPPDFDDAKTEVRAVQLASFCAASGRNYRCASKKIHQQSSRKTPGHLPGGQWRWR